MKRTGFKPRAQPLKSSGPAKAAKKLKRCKAPGCGQRFLPQKPWQILCTDSVDCAVAWAGAEAAKKTAAELRRLEREARKERAADKLKLKALEPIRKFEKRAEKAVNRYVRARDFHLGCISCDKPADWNGQWHASHYRSVGAASAVRFNLWNIHRGCWICNKLYSGRIDAYTPNIIERIGQDKVDWLKSQNQRTDYDREYLTRLASVMNRKASRQEKRNRSAA